MLCLFLPKVRDTELGQEVYEVAPAIHEAAMTRGIKSTLGYQEHALCSGQDLKHVESK